MKYNHHKIIALLLGAGLLGLSGIAAAAVAPILGSKHDFSSTGGGVNATTGAGTSTTDTCVFCHTPHAAASGSVPLWNKKLPTATTFTTYTSSTLDAAAITSGAVTSGPSVACLSCHDGSQAVDNVINAAGSGGYNPAGVSQGYAFASDGTVIDATTNTIIAGRVSIVGTNLGDDHPISVQYAGGGYGTGATGKDPDFLAPKDNGLTGVDKRWWVDTAPGTANVRDKQDMILYTRNVVTPATYEPFVECASCHDPHNGAADQMFLRIANTSSAVCVACHTK